MPSLTHAPPSPSSPSTQDDIVAAVGALKTLRAQLAELADAAKEEWKVDMETLDTVRIRRMFVVPSFEIHSGVAGLFDFGPPGCGMKDALLSIWRQHFVLEESMLQLEPGPGSYIVDGTVLCAYSL